MKHPNALTAGGASSLGVLVVWLAGYFGVDLGAEEGAAIAGVAATVALFVGRKGILGLARVLWRGSGS